MIILLYDTVLMLQKVKGLVDNINHANHQYNAKTIVVRVESRPHLYIIATRDLVNGEEILYDYADRRENVVKDHPWLKQ